MRRRQVGEALDRERVANARVLARVVVAATPAGQRLDRTRAALGVGIGLLLSGKMTGSQRRAVGVTLVAIGVATTIPAAMAVFHNQRATSIQDS